MLRVLLIDDEPDIVSVLGQGLKLKGFEVDGFTDPIKALEQFKPGKDIHQKAYWISRVGGKIDARVNEVKAKSVR